MLLVYLLCVSNLLSPSLSLYSPAGSFPGVLPPYCGILPEGGSSFFLSPSSSTSTPSPGMAYESARKEIPCAEAGCCTTFVVSKGITSYRSSHRRYIAKDQKDADLTDVDILAIPDEEKAKRFDCRPSRICAPCEQKHRVKEFATWSAEAITENPNYCDLAIIHRDMKKGNKESTWHYRITINKTIDERFKNLRTSEPDLSRRELKARKSNIARDVAHKFKEALENCKDLSKFIATFPTRLNIQTEEGRKVLDLYELYLKDPFDESRLAALEKAEDAWEITHEYQCYLGDPQQANCLLYTSPSPRD